jgi:sugar (pentulose or hexulose) kinase
MLSWMDARVSRGVTDLDPATEWITTSSGYVTHRLTGRFIDTAGNYQGVWPIDQSTWRWSADDATFERTGMPRDTLFDLVDPGALAGGLTADAAAATGLPAGLPVFATSNDKAVEALGSGLLGPSAALLSLGTYIAAMIVADRPQELGDAGWRNFGAIPGQYLYESHGIRRGMWTASWFRELLGDGVTDEELGAAAELVPAGSGGLVAILDWLAPTDAPYRRGALLGFDGSQSRGAFYRALLEGIALTMHGHLSRLIDALQTAPEHIVVSGGGSKSDMMLQIVADLAGIPAKRLAMPDAAGLGAAITAAVGVSAFSGWLEAVTRMVHVDTVKVPTAAGSARYAALAERYAQVTSYTDPLFRMLSGDSTVPAPNH